MESKAHIKFKKTIRRCNELINIYNQLKIDHRYNQNKDIVRGAVVLSVAAFDAYITDVFCEKLIEYIKKFEIKDDLICLLSEAGLSTKMALELIKTDRPNRKIRTLIENHYSKYTTQRFEVVDKLFLKYGIAKITSCSANRAGRKSLGRSVEILIQKRHEIAHNGDYNKHNKIRDINELAVQKRIKDIKLLVENMDYIILNRIH